MDFLISFYDNALIYYPNAFFAVLFFISILGIVLVSIGIIVLWKKIKRVIQKIKNDLKQIKIKERKKISLVPMVRVFFERKKTSFICIIRFLAISFAYMIKITFIRINTALGHIESETEKIVKRIEKEVLIEE